MISEVDLGCAYAELERALGKGSVDKNPHPDHHGKLIQLPDPQRA
jgi:hypothetical protein